MHAGADIDPIYDPEDERTQLHHYPIYQRLRDEFPVYGKSACASGH